MIPLLFTRKLSDQIHSLQRYITNVSNLIEIEPVIIACGIHHYVLFDPW